MVASGVVTRESRGITLDANKITPLGHDVDDVPDIFAIIVESIGSGATATASIDWIEYE